MSLFEKGFTVLEMLLTVTLLSVLLTVGYPTYHSFLYRSHRLSGKIALLSLATTLAEHHAKYHTYEGASAGSLSTPYYHLRMETTPTTYVLYATPQGSQTRDPCGTLTLTHTYQYGPKQSCWQ